LSNDSSLMQALTDKRRQTRVVVYGRSLHTYALIQGLISRGVSPHNILFAIPRINCHVNESEDISVEQDIPIIYPEPFDDISIMEKIDKMLEEKGVTIMREAKLIEIITDKDREAENSKGKENGEEEHKVQSGNGCLEKVVFKLLDIPDNEEEEESEMSQMEDNEDKDNSEKGDMDENMSENSGDDISGMDGEGNGHEKKKKRKKNEKEVTCGVLVTCGHKDVD